MPNRITIRETLLKINPASSTTTRRVTGGAVTVNGTVNARVAVSFEKVKVCLAMAPGTDTPSASSLTVTVVGMVMQAPTVTVEWKAT